MDGRKSMLKYQCVSTFIFSDHKLVSCYASCLLGEEGFPWLSCFSRTNWTSFFTQDDLGFRHTFAPLASPALVINKQTNKQINNSMMDTMFRCSWCFFQFQSQIPWGNSTKKINKESLNLDQNLSDEQLKEFCFFLLLLIFYL